MKIEHDALKVAEEKMDKSIRNFQKELSNLRAGRANAHLLDSIMVDYYGNPTPVSQVGNVSTPEARLLVISLWDATMLQAVEKAIMKSDLGITPMNDGKVIRLAFPEVTGEKRQELVKQAKKRAEETKIVIRSVRRDANEVFKKEKKSSELTEDDFNIVEKEAQDLTDKKIKEVEDLLAEKEKDIMEI